MHRIALDTIEREEAFDFIAIPESTRRVIRFHWDERLIHAPTAAMIYQFREVLGRARHPRRRSGTAGVCLEVGDGARLGYERA